MSAKNPLVMSFGGGVQTVAMAALAANGEIERPDFCVFADPGNESKLTYRYISTFSKWMAERGLRLIVASRGNLADDVLNLKGKRTVPLSLPVFTLSPTGEKGMLMRQCTQEYKITIVFRTIRRELGLVRKRLKPDAIRVALGISTDEVIRMKPCRAPGFTNCWPLIEKRMSRQDCLDYIKKCGLPKPPKSACIFCPYHSDAFWKEMRVSRPDEWDEAVKFDYAIREKWPKMWKKAGSKMKSTVFLHSQRVPLNQVKLGAMHDEPDLFGNECEGHCGL